MQSNSLLTQAEVDYIETKPEPITEAPASTDRLAAVKQTTQKIKQDLRMGREHQEGRVNWITTIFMGLFHVGAVAALLPMFW